MKAISSLLAQLGDAWNRFFFTPADPRLCALLRIGFALLLLISNLACWNFVEMWFGEAGVLPHALSLNYKRAGGFSLFDALPHDNATMYTLYWLFNAHLLLLLLGAFSRIQAAAVFVYAVSFQHRNDLILDGEDILFRLFAFFLIFLPIGQLWSLDALWRNRWAPRFVPAKLYPKWPLRCLQIEFSMVIFSSALYKLRGPVWRDGTALYYISRLDDFFGRFWAPPGLFDSPNLLRVMTWTVIGLELAAPVAIWFRRTRLPAMIVLIGLHLAIDYTMNLFLFQWIMILGWLTFLTREDLDRISAWKVALAPNWAVKTSSFKQSSQSRARPASLPSDEAPADTSPDTSGKP